MMDEKNVMGKGETLGEKNEIGREKILNAKSGYGMLFLWILVLLGGIALIVLGPIFYSRQSIGGGLLGTSIALGVILFLFPLSACAG